MHKTSLSLGSTFIESKTKLEKEVELLQMVSEKDFKNVAGMIEHMPSKNNYYLIMQAANCGDLFDFVRAKGGFLSENEA